MRTIHVDRIKALNIKKNTVLVLKDIDNSEEILESISAATDCKGNIAIILGGDSDIFDISKAELLKVCKQAGITADDFKE